jgi:hypothetical protein
MADTPRDPDGTQAAKTRRIGGPVRSTRRRSTRSSAKPDLDARNERMVGPRKPMGPPLKDPVSKRAASRVRSSSTPTDPAMLRLSRKRPSTTSTRRRAKKARRRR